MTVREKDALELAEEELADAAQSYSSQVHEIEHYWPATPGSGKRANEALEPKWDRLAEAAVAYAEARAKAAED